ncbi:hypothetical protein H7I77_06080 [Mycolicibacterium novocastrense]|uniref:Internalin-related protein n=1 Tax=Mycolicibacterium novocastrense TaxID=59813 RepID=A0AAW5SGY3_MYCNV|nr:hypothetical protein [Mycolicibacterium novocastrense]MCV7022920.1 hypothetical protein [Mycolicibacterium novocastrense]GAT10992.1 internalin-related protein [Mycolicibacterium novocastrense]
MARREVSGDFDYLIDDPVDVADAADSGADADAEVFDPAKVPGRDMLFDAFDENSWYFAPAPPPWYRTKRNLSLLLAAAIAAVALVVSAVLLVFGAPGEPADREPEPVRPTVQTTAPARTSPQSPSTPPPPRPAPPPRVETSAAPVAPPPPATYRPRTPPTRTGRDPEIGVTRTPVTRSPISVAPQRPSQR